MRIPMKPPNLAEIGQNLPEDFWETLLEGQIGVTQGERYRHWDKLRYLNPPMEISHEQWWFAIKWARKTIQKPIPLMDRAGRVFRYGVPDIAHKFLHETDKRLSGTIGAKEDVVDIDTKNVYLVRSLIEEAITSSQLEGAATTRKVAKEMLRVGRRPENTHERMIYNNYQAMNTIKALAKEPLSESAILDLHRVLTTGTLKNENDCGRLRTQDDIVVEDDQGKLLHTPPLSAELEARLKMLCEFANEGNSDPFLHPVIKSIILHFWIAYDHPFVDGNGRIARAIFYWSMLKHGYWLAEFFSISSIIKKAPARYARAFLYTETDDNDLTYFVLNQLETISKSIESLYEYLDRKTKDLHASRRLLNASKKLREVLNHRQLSVMNHALRQPQDSFTIDIHKREQQISYQTARTDLEELAELGLLEKSKISRMFVYTAPENLQERIRTAD